MKRLIIKIETPTVLTNELLALGEELGSRELRKVRKDEFTYWMHRPWAYFDKEDEEDQHDNKQN